MRSSHSISLVFLVSIQTLVKSYDENVFSSVTFDQLDPKDKLETLWFTYMVKCEQEISETMHQLHTAKGIISWFRNEFDDKSYHVPPHCRHPNAGNQLVKPSLRYLVLESYKILNALKRQFANKFIYECVADIIQPSRMPNSVKYINQRILSRYGIFLGLRSLVNAHEVMLELLHYLGVAMHHLNTPVYVNRNADHL